MKKLVISKGPAIHGPKNCFVFKIEGWFGDLDEWAEEEIRANDEARAIFIWQTLDKFEKCEYEEGYIETPEELEKSKSFSQEEKAILENLPTDQGENILTDFDFNVFWYDEEGIQHDVSLS